MRAALSSFVLGKHHPSADLDKSSRAILLRERSHPRSVRGAASALIPSIPGGQAIVFDRRQFDLRLH
jgi:hypothetical protein